MPFLLMCINSIGNPHRPCEQCHYPMVQNHEVICNAWTRDTALNMKVPVS